MNRWESGAALKREPSLFFNFLILTLTSLALQTASLLFRAYYARALGAEGLGLLQLTVSVSFLGVTMATSGIRLTATRLVAEELGARRRSGAEAAVRRCLLYALVCGLGAMTLLNLGAGRIGTAWLHDGRTVLSLRIFAFSLPLCSLSSVLDGYLIAARRAPAAAGAEVLEKLTEVGAGVGLLRLWLPLGHEYACAAIVLGSALGKAVSLLALLALCRADWRRHRGPGPRAAPDLTRRMFRIAVPLAFGAYLSALFRTVEQLLIPYGLKRSGASAAAALASFGVISGMALPLLMFPVFLLSALLELLLPELAGSMETGHTRRMNYLVGRMFRLGVLFSMCVMWMFLRFSGELGQFVYHSADAGVLIRQMAALTPFFYLDLIVDMVLKGIGEQVSTVKHNLLTSVLSAALLYLLLPRYGIAGYLAAAYLTKILNFILSFWHLAQVTDLTVSMTGIVKSILSVVAATGLTDLLTEAIPGVETPASLLSQVLLIVLFYLLFLRAMDCITHEDIVWGRSLLRWPVRKKAPGINSRSARTLRKNQEWL